MKTEVPALIWTNMKKIVFSLAVLAAIITACTVKNNPVIPEDNPAPGEEKRLEKAILRTLSTTKSEAEATVSVAHGTARGKGVNITQVVNEADAAMYACKRIVKGENSEAPRQKPGKIQ